MDKQSTRPNEQSEEAGSVLDLLRNALEQYNPRLWTERHISTERGKPLEFANRPWLKQIYDDHHPRIAVQKAAQIGATMWAFTQAVYEAAVHGRTIIYTMPTQDDARSFVTGRANRIMDASPTLRELAQRSGKQGDRRPADNAAIKHIGEGTIYFRGTQTEGEALSIPADALFHDEVDRSHPETLEMYAHRLDALPFMQRRISQLSTPTVPSYGISAQYEASDAREWLVRCRTPGCKWQGTLDYWEHTEGHLLYLRCTGCSKPLDPLNGEWVAAHPERSNATHGYLVSRLFMALPNSPDVLQGLHQRRASAHYERHFVNMVLGLPSTEGTTSITRGQILGACFVETYAMNGAPEYGTGPYFMGVDQGDTLTVLIGRADPQRDGGRIRIVYAARLRDPQLGSDAWRQVAELINLFPITMCVVDALPNSANAHDLAKNLPGRVLTCYYTEGMKAEVLVAGDVTRRAVAPPLYNDNQPLPSTTRSDITVNRTEALDRTAYDLVQGKFLLPSPPTHSDVDRFMRDCENNVRRPVEGKDGVPIFRWERIGPNDYFHALNYLRLAVEEGQRLSELGAVYYGPVIILGARPRSLKNRHPLGPILKHYYNT